MKRIVSSALVFGVLSFPVVGLLGCGEESRVKEETKVSGPGGSTTETKETKVKATGDGGTSGPATTTTTTK